MIRKRILLKVTGEVLLSSDKHTLDGNLLGAIAQQIKHLSATHYFGIVIGGGNFFRGSKHGKALGITPSVGHQIGMLATMMNGLIVKDVFEKNGIDSTIFCAVPASEVGRPISQQAIESALSKEQCMIFTGGTGNPFFTTDTTAVLRGLQIDAHEIWKGTNVDGIYTADPKIDPTASIISRISYQEVLNQRLRIMDATAIALAQEHSLTIRVFNIFKSQAIVHATQSNTFGSIIGS
jgi:uridylate kinase